MDIKDKKCCANCKYFRIQEEYWHDHYLIREHQYCSYYSRCNEYEVKSDHCCKNFESKISNNV